MRFIFFSASAIAFPMLPDTAAKALGEAMQTANLAVSHQTSSALTHVSNMHSAAPSQPGFTWVPVHPQQLGSTAHIGGSLPAAHPAMSNQVYAPVYSHNQPVYPQYQNTGFRPFAGYNHPAPSTQGLSQHDFYQAWANYFYHLSHLAPQQHLTPGVAPSSSDYQALANYYFYLSQSASQQHPHPAFSNPVQAGLPNLANNFPQTTVHGAINPNSLNNIPEGPVVKLDGTAADASIMMPARARAKNNSPESLNGNPVKASSRSTPKIGGIKRPGTDISSPGAKRQNLEIDTNQELEKALAEANPESELKKLFLEWREDGLPDTFKPANAPLNPPNTFVEPNTLEVS